MIELLLSGGQSGVDLASLDAAKELGILTGGWMPKGFITEDGEKPEYARLFGLQEMPTADYPARTRRNVEEADATLVLVDTEQQFEGGTALTLRICEQVGKPYTPLMMGRGLRSDAIMTVRVWLAAYDVRVLNVGGPRESKAPGIYERAREFLLEVFKGEAS